MEEYISALSKIDRFSLLVIAFISVLVVFIVYRKPFGKILELLIKRSDQPQISVVQITSEAHPGARYVREYGHSLSFLSPLRINDSDSFYDYLFAVVSELRARLSNPYPNVRLTISLTQVDVISSGAIGAFSRLVSEVKENDGIFLNFIFPPGKHQAIAENLKMISDNAEHISIITAGGGDKQ